MQELLKTALRKRHARPLGESSLSHCSGVHSYCTNEFPTRAFGARSTLLLLLLLLKNSDFAQKKPRRNPLANPFPDPSLATQIQPPLLLSQPPPLFVPATHGALSNTAPLPPTVQVASYTAVAKNGEGILMEAGYWPPIARLGRYHTYCWRIKTDNNMFSQCSYGR